MYSVPYPVSTIRTRIRQEFERNRFVNKLPVVDILLHKSNADYQVRASILLLVGAGCGIWWMLRAVSSTRNTIPRITLELEARLPRAVGSQKDSEGEDDENRGLRGRFCSFMRARPGKLLPNLPQD